MAARLKRMSDPSFGCQCDSRQRIEHNVSAGRTCEWCGQEVALPKREQELRMIAFYGVGSPSNWEANPSGVSGRLVRGYRHWRHKR